MNAPSKKRKMKKIAMMENRGLIDKCPGRQVWERLSKETNNYYGCAVSTDSNEKFPTSLSIDKYFHASAALAVACMADESATLTVAKDIQRRRLLQVAALFA